MKSKIHDYLKEHSKSMSKKTIIITILFSLLSAISTYLLFDSMEGFKTDIGESKTAVKEMQTQMNTIENKYKTEIQYWVHKNDSLQQHVQKTEVALHESKQKTNSLQGKIHLLISESSNLTDTSQIVSNCDSLKEQVNLYITETNLKDSLCDDEISDLKNVIQNKDSAFAVSERGFNGLTKLMDVSLARQTALAEQLNLAEKKIRRENRKTKFLSAGVFILSGITVTLLLHK